jgi:hypothetical protein
MEASVPGEPPPNGPDAPGPPEAGETAEDLGASDRLTSFLVVFVRDVDTIVGLREVLLLGPGRQRFEDVELVRALGAGWDEVLAALPELFDKLKGPDAESTLRGLGLDGRQLDGKFMAWRGPRAEAVRAFADSDDPRERYPPLGDRPSPETWADTNEPLQEIFYQHDRHMKNLGLDPTHDQLPSRQPRDVGGAMKWVCRFMDLGLTILGSLAGPFGAAEPLKEFGEVLKKVLCHVAADAEATAED